MNNFNLVKLLLTSIIFFIISLSVSAQSISGNVNSALSSKNLGFANVNIYKNGKLVANVLTDKDGNFKIKLDTGIYKCEINYAGFKKITKEIKVSKDEKAAFSLPADEKSKFSAAEVETLSAPKSDVVYEIGAASETEIIGYGTAKTRSKTASKYESKDKVISTKNAWGESKKNTTSTSGKLTAGEINDFSKWNLWTDLTKGELKENQLFWKFAPSNRYLMQLNDQTGLPLANAKVELLSGEKVIYTSKSDNTGKAELWEILKYDSLSKLIATSIRVEYNGETKTIKKIKPFKKGINTLTFNTNCKQSQNVDIAMVVDATGSMQDEIDYLKSDLNDVIYKSKEFSNTLNLRFANVFYRDHGDKYLTQSQDFTSVLSESVAYTNQHNADGGGDYEEAVEIALDSAINKLSWNSDTRTKLMFLVLDAPPHNTPEIREKMQDLCYKAAEKGIRIVPITGSGTNKNTEYLMRCLALATNGTYTFLTDHSGIGDSHIKPSTDNYQVEILNELLVRVIKSFTYMPDCQKNIADLDVNLPDSQVVVRNYMDTTKIDSVKPSKIKDSIEFQWKFYPNPTKDIINIVSSKEITELYISDLSGKVLKIINNVKPDKIVTADLSEYSTGIYLIRYPIGKQWISGKIVLLRE